MADIRIGLDFGTSNSAAALAGQTANEPVKILSIDPNAEDARLFRSVLFFPEASKEICAGEEAIRRYFEEGEGRFLQSIKSFLPQSSFDSTRIRSKSLKLEEILAILLRKMRERIETLTKSNISHAVFGRPAVFSQEAKRDQLAQDRLLQAAKLAGFPTPSFLIEPIAAAFGYEETLQKDEIVLVGDFGAGTSDFTLIRLGPSYRNNPDRNKDVIAWNGLRIGGDRFDAAIVEHRLLAHFGEGSTYQAFSKRMPLPAWMTRKLLAWHELSLLRNHKNLDFLHKILHSSSASQAIQNLIRLVEDNLPYHLYRSIEAAKRILSTKETAIISFHMSEIHIEETITREEFETWTKPLRKELFLSVEKLLASAGGILPDAIFLTGGTSKIPSVQKMFTERFGKESLREGDAFASVVAGLGYAAANHRNI